VLLRVASGRTFNAGAARFSSCSSGRSAYAVAAYILVCAVLTLIATAMMKDYTGKDIEGEYE
jgi:hypothetical protein